MRGKLRVAAVSFLLVSTTLNSATAGFMDAFRSMTMVALTPACSIPPESLLNYNAVKSELSAALARIQQIKKQMEDDKRSAQAVYDKMVQLQSDIATSCLDQEDKDKLLLRIADARTWGFSNTQTFMNFINGLTDLFKRLMDINAVLTQDMTDLINLPGRCPDEMETDEAIQKVRANIAKMTAIATAWSNFITTQFGPCFACVVGAVDDEMDQVQRELDRLKADCGNVSLELNEMSFSKFEF